MRTGTTKRCRRLLAGSLMAAMLLSALPGTVLALGASQPSKQVWDFSDSVGFLGTITEGRMEGAVTMQAQVTGGRLMVSGTHSGGEGAQVYTTLYEDLSIPVTRDTRLSYHIVPQQPGSGYDYDCYSMHVALDLRFSDGTYLSKLEVEDQNRVLMNPDSQGEAKAVVYGQDNLITVNVGEQAGLAGKTITGVLVGYANRGSLKAGGGNYRAELDDIRIEAVRPVYDTLADYVNILRGTNNLGGTSRTISRGLTGPMVAIPHGFNFWAPENNAGDDIFVYNTGTISAIRCSHEPSVWVGERGRWTFMVDNGKTGNPKYDPETLVTKAHYFSADFTSGKGEDTRLEMTPTDHGVAARFTYAPGLAKRGIVLDQLSSLSVDQGKATFTARAPAGNNGLPSAYVYGEFDRPVETYASGAFTFAESRSGNTVVTMRLATSFISADQAKANFSQEVAGKKFDTIMTTAKALWNEKLGVVEIEGATEEQMISFYSNMYRLFLYPNSMGEYTGQGAEGGWQYMSPHGKGLVDGRLYYNNGFWDTYRTTWAAYSLLTPAADAEMLVGLLQHYEDSGWIPRWVAPAGTNSMVGTSSDVIFGDAAMRGVELSDAQWATAYQAALKNAAMSAGASAAGGRDSLSTGIFLGYTPGTGNEKMSWAIEGYINDFGISNMAWALGDEDAYEYYLSRATNYVNLFDERNGGWFRGKDQSGSFGSATIDPISWGNAYTETNAWNMAFSVPQDGQGLANLYGGREKLAAKLDEFFNTPGDYRAGGYGGTIHEMREAQEVKLGQYGHSNQPSHHIPYMYLYAGRPDRTQEVVRAVLRQCYVGSRIGQGYIGDEDNGEMSAWYIFSALGFYPLNMGSGELVFGSPLFTKATIHHENGHDLIISAPNNSRDNIYVGGLTINGATYDGTSILQTDLTDRLKSEDVTLTFAMQPTPSSWGANAPPASITEGVESADPLRDRTVSTAAVLTQEPDSPAPVSTPSVYSAGAANLKNLFDNNSGTSATLTPADGKASVLYCFPEPTAVSLYTLTSGQSSAKAPASFALFGSSDGKTWTQLDERSGVGFDWSTYTKPFAAQIPDFLQFHYFRLDIYSSSTIELAELELMGRTPPTLDRAFLNALIAQAQETKTALESDGYPRLAALLGEAVTAAQSVADDPEATESAIGDACADLAGAIADLSGLTGLWAELDAAKGAQTAGMPDAVATALSAAIGSAETAVARGTADELKSARSGLRSAMEGVDLCRGLDLNLAKAAGMVDGLGQALLKGLLGDAIDAARAVRENRASTLADLTEEAAALEKAMNEIPGLTRLWTLLDEAKALDTTGKAEAMVKYLKAAIAAAEETIKTAAAARELQNALYELERVMANMDLKVIRPGYERIEAESYDGNLGIVIDNNSSASGGKNIGGINPGEWVRYDGVLFDGNGAGKIEIRYSAASDGGGQIKVILDDLSNEPICILNAPVTGSWNTWSMLSANLAEPASGIHSIYLSFTGGNSHVANVDWLQLSELASGSIVGSVDASAVAEQVPDLTALTAKLYNAKAPETVLQAVAPAGDGAFTFTGLSSGVYEVVLEGLSEDIAPVRERVSVGSVEVPLALQLKRNAEVTVVIGGWAYGDTAKEPVYSSASGGEGTWTLTYEGRESTEYAESETVPTDAGDYRFTAVYEDESFRGSARADFTITKAERTLTVTGWGNPILLPGALTHRVEAATDTDADESAELRFDSSDSAVAVDGHGLVTALENGKAVITVSIPETRNYQAAEAVELPVRAVVQPLTDVSVTAEGTPDVMEVTGRVDDETVYLAGFITAGTTLIIEPQCPGVELVGVPVTAVVAGDQSEIKVTVNDEETQVAQVYTYAIDRSGVVELPEGVAVEQREPEVSTGDTGLFPFYFEEMEIPGLAAVMPPEVAQHAQELFTDELKAEGYDRVVVRVYPRVEVVAYEAGRSMNLDIMPMYTIVAQRGATAHLADHESEQLARFEPDLSGALAAEDAALGDALTAAESRVAAQPAEITLLEPTAVTELIAPVTVTFELPYELPEEGLHVRHSPGGGAAVPLPATVDQGLISFTTKFFGLIEFSVDNRSVTVNFARHSGETETRTYTAEDLGVSLPRDSRSGYTFAGWSIGGAVYTTVTDSLLDMGASVEASASFIENSGGGSSSGVASYTIRASAGEGGSISPEGQIRVFKNSDKIFTILAEEGYRLADVLVDGKSLGAVERYSFQAVSANHQIEARFEKMARPDTPLPYVDVRETDWFYPAVRFVTDRKLFQGTGADSFGPAGDMTRAMLVTVLARLDGQDTAGGETWYSKAVAWGVESGITDGTNAEMSITRESLVVMLYRYAKAEPSDSTALRAFPDADQVSGWADDAMSWAVANGILTGNGRGELNPGGTASRAEVAVILQRFLSL